MSFAKELDKNMLRILVLKILSERQSFLHKLQNLRRSKPTSRYNLSLEIPLLAPIIARQPLHWIDSSLSWKELLKV